MELRISASAFGNCHLHVDLACVRVSSQVRFSLANALASDVKAAAKIGGSSKYQCGTDSATAAGVRRLKSDMIPL
jgi:hypothetical protein